MALITLVNETKLKSLKFGGDVPGGGSSNQPFIQTAIPGTQTTGQSTAALQNILNKLPQQLTTTAGQGTAALQNILNKLPQELTRATSLLATLPGVTDPGIGLTALASATDMVRLTKFFKTPEGLAFVAKQNLLSRIAVNTQASGFLLNDYAYLPTSTIAQAGVNAFGGHLNKQGVNPFLGFGDRYTPDRYYDVVRTEQLRSRLKLGVGTASFNVKGSIPSITLPTLNVPNVKLPLPIPFLPPVTIGGAIGGQTIFGGAAFQTSGKVKYPTVSQTGPIPIGNRLVQLKIGGGSLVNDPAVMMIYQGGPGSELGVGRTKIFTEIGNDGFPIRTLQNLSSGTQFSTVQRYAMASEMDVVEELARVSPTPQDPGAGTVIDFRQALRRSKNAPKLPSSSMAAAQAPDYYVDGLINLEKRVNLNNPAASNRNLSSYVAGTGTKTYDAITAFPIYRSEVIPTAFGPKVNDLVKFRIAAIDNDNPLVNEYIHFRAFLGNITDSYNADWDSVQYMGRGDKLYSYKGFGRSINLSWMVAAQSKQELIPMYQKLNFLASNLAPDYSGVGYMRGPLINLTVGGYLYEVPGFVTGMTLEMSEEYPWEIGIEDTGLGGEDKTVKELSQVIRVSNFAFTPIHRFIPAKQNNKYSTDNGQMFASPGSDDERIKKLQQGKGLGVIETFGPTRFISLDAGAGSNNYDSNKGILMPYSI